jgi:hypothetical protein
MTHRAAAILLLLTGILVGLAFRESTTFSRAAGDAAAVPKPSERGLVGDVDVLREALEALYRCSNSHTGLTHDRQINVKADNAKGIDRLSELVSGKGGHYRAEVGDIIVVRASFFASATAPDGALWTIDCRGIEDTVKRETGDFEVLERPDAGVVSEGPGQWHWNSAFARFRCKKSGGVEFGFLFKKSNDLNGRVLVRGLCLEAQTMINGIVHKKFKDEWKLK